MTRQHTLPGAAWHRDAVERCPLPRIDAPPPNTAHIWRRVRADIAANNQRFICFAIDDAPWLAGAAPSDQAPQALEAVRLCRKYIADALHEASPGCALEGWVNEVHPLFAAQDMGELGVRLDNTRDYFQQVRLRWLDKIIAACFAASPVVSPLTRAQWGAVRQTFLADGHIYICMAIAATQSRRMITVLDGYRAAEWIQRQLGEHKTIESWRYKEMHLPRSPGDACPRFPGDPYGDTRSDRYSTAHECRHEWLNYLVENTTS